MYDVDYFIRKFEATSEDQWMTYSYTNVQETRFCALGWCGARGNNRTSPTLESNGLALLFSKYMLRVPEINDGTHPRYPQPTPKQRILAALYDIKKMQQPKREKVKVQISPDLLTPPIPKDVEKIDRYTYTPEEAAEKIIGSVTVQSAINDFYKSLGSYGDAIDKTIDLVMDIAYKDYKRAREGHSYLTPEFFEGIYRKEDIEKFESRYQRELKA